MPTADEIRLFAQGGHNAEALAVMCLAKRTDITPAAARLLLSAAVR